MITYINNSGILEYDKAIKKREDKQQQNKKKKENRRK